MVVMENNKSRIAYFKWYKNKQIKECECECRKEAHTDIGGLEMHNCVSECKAKGESL